MFSRLVLVLCLSLSLVFAQGMKMTVGQLKSVLRSSLQLKHSDKQIADYLKKIILTEQIVEKNME